MPRQPKPEATAETRDTQQRICEKLLAAASLRREALAKQLPDLNSKQLTQALFNASAAGRCQRVDDKDGPNAWALTPLGRRWITAKLAGAATPAPKARKSQAKAPPAKRAKPGAKVRRRRAETAEIAAPASSNLAGRAFEPVVERSFRCAVFSDGSFVLAKAGQEIALTKPELSEALRYLERMAEQSA